MEEKQINIDVILQKTAAVANVVSSQWMHSFVDGPIGKEPHKIFRLKVFAKQVPYLDVSL